MIEQMETKTWWWTQEDDLVKGIIYCLETISHYIEVGQPTFFERYGWYLLFAGYCLLFCLRPWIHVLLLRMKQEKKRELLEMNEKEKLEAMTLMDQYQCYSCPICLEDYEVKDEGSSASSLEEDDNVNDEQTPQRNYNSFSRKVYYGIDNDPIQLLRCGHSTCKQCWKEWLATGQDQGLCPVCKEDILQ